MDEWTSDDNPETTGDGSRRQFIRKLAWVAPAPTGVAATAEPGAAAAVWRWRRVG